MQGTKKKPKTNDNGSIAVLKEKPEKAIRPGLRPEIEELHRQKDVEARLSRLSNMTNDELIQAAIYGVQPEERAAAICMIGKDEYALLRVMRHSPHKDAVRAAEKTLFCRTEGDAEAPEPKEPK